MVSIPKRLLQHGPPPRDVSSQWTSEDSLSLEMKTSETVPDETSRKRSKAVSVSVALALVGLLGIGLVTASRDNQSAGSSVASATSDTTDLGPNRSNGPSKLPEPASKIAADLAEAGIPPVDDARNSAIAKTLVDAVVGLGADKGWEPTDVIVRLKENSPFYMIADSPGDFDRDQASVTIEIRQYRADELTDPEHLEEIGLSKPVERSEDGSSLFIRDDPQLGFASSTVVLADLVISVRSQDLISQDRGPVKADVLADVARGVASIAQAELSAK